MYMHVLFTPLGCTATAVSESPQASDLLLGFLGRLGFGCPLLRGLLRVLLVGCLGVGLATTGHAAVALSVVLAYASPATLLTLIPPSPVFTPPTNPHLLGLGLRPVMASVLLTVVQQQLLASPNPFARIQQHFSSIVIKRVREFTVIVWIAAVPTPVQH